jgi:hypothetical protein
LGSALLLTILFLPDGLGSLFQRRGQAGNPAEKSARKAGK